MTEGPLGRYDGIVCDLDGVVYAGPGAIPHAIASLQSTREHGTRVVYATNNASRPPSAVAAHLRELGLRLDDEDVVNSSMAAAHVLRESGAQVRVVLPIGGEGVARALREAGFVCVGDDDAGAATGDIDAVVQGYGPDVRATDLAAAAHAVNGGARWVATNTDLTLPTEKGIAPGNGSLVQAVRNAVAVDPEVAGKPMPVMYDMASERIGAADASRVLAVGDRLETDIEGATRGGYDSVLVLTGVHGLADAAAAPKERRPTYVLADLRGLTQPYEVETAGKCDAGASIARVRGLLTSLWERVDAGDLSAEDAAREMRQACGS